MRAITRSKQPCTRVAGIRSPLTSLAHALARPAAERHPSTLVYLQSNAMASPSASTASSTTGFAASGFLCLPQARRPAGAEQGLSLPHRPPHPVYLCLNRGVHEALRGQVAGVHLSASLLGNLASWARIATLAVVSTYYPRAWAHAPAAQDPQVQDGMSIRDLRAAARRCSVRSRSIVATARTSRQDLNG